MRPPTIDYRQDLLSAAAVSQESLEHSTEEIVEMKRQDYKAPNAMLHLGKLVPMEMQDNM